MGNAQRGKLGSEGTEHLGDDVGEMGDALPYVKLGAGRTVKQLVSGFNHNCVILDSDEVKCWGWNIKGQLGYGDKLDRGTAPGQMGDNLPSVDLGAGRTAT